MKYEKGNIPWNKNKTSWSKGLSLSEKHRKNIRESLKQHYQKNGTFEHTSEAKKKISQAGVKYPQLQDRNWLYQKYVIEKLGTENIMVIVGCAGSSVVYRALQRVGITPRGYTKGSAHWQWKGGISKDRENVRKNLHHTIEYKLWRKAVYERDDYTCRACGKRGVRLEPHHILPIRDFWHLRFDISNGMTLCKKCHSKTVFKEYLFIQSYEKRGELLETLRVLLPMAISSRAPKGILEKVQRLIAESRADSNANTSTPPERDEIVRTVEKSTEV